MAGSRIKFSNGDSLYVDEGVEDIALYLNPGTVAQLTRQRTDRKVLVFGANVLYVEDVADGEGRAGIEFA